MAKSQKDIISDTSTLGDYARLVRRRKWIVLQAAVLVPLIVLALTLTQEELFQAESRVLLNPRDATDVLFDLSGRPNTDDLDRDAATQADLAESPALARRVLARVGSNGQTTDELLDRTTVEARAGSDLLRFKVDDPSPLRARRLANAYAAEYVRYRARLGAASLNAAQAELDRRLANLGGDTDSPLARELRSTQRRLQTVAALQGGDATFIRRAEDAEKVQPKPVRNTVIGLLLGLVLGLALAVLRDLFDRRVRSADEAAALLGLPLLARLPGRELRRRGSSRLPLVHEPEGPGADAYRTLMYRVQMANVERRAQVLLVTSAVEGEGKTTTAANLALAFARAGQSTTLVELDLWRPALHRMFGFKTRAGLADVLLGRALLSEVMVKADTGGVVAQNGGDPGLGRLQVLPAGVSPSHPSDLIALPVLADVLATLRIQAELVIVDAPPLVQGGDGIALAAKADALIVVTRLAGVRREGLQELGRRLQDIPVPALGIAVTDAERDDSDRWRRYYRAEPVARQDSAVAR